MLIEAAKGGHTGVVSVLIDYNPNNLSTTATTAGAVTTATSAEASGEVVSDNVATTNATNTNTEEALIPSTRYEFCPDINKYQNVNSNVDN